MSHENHAHSYYYTGQYPDQLMAPMSPLPLTTNANIQRQFQQMQPPYTDQYQDPIVAPTSPPQQPANTNIQHHYQPSMHFTPYSPQGHSSASQGQVMPSNSIPSMHSTAFSSFKKPAKKRVTFKPTCTVRTHTGRGITKEEKSKVYYSKDELQLMTLEAQAICTLSQELPDIRNSGTLLTMERRESMLGLDDDEEALDSLRGLELIMYPKRKQNKLLALKSLLKYQTFLNSKKPEVGAERKHLALAGASAKLNKWSSLVAMETARLDALRAFEGDYLIPITTQPAWDIIPPFPFYKKRHDQQRRRGSRRVTPPPQDDGVDIGQRDFKRRKVG